MKKPASRSKHSSPKSNKIRLDTWYRDGDPKDSRYQFALVPHWRFGVLLGPEQIKGDLHESYCCQLLGEANPGQIPGAKYFLYNGIRYISAGGVYGGPGSYSDCYELVEVTPNLILPKVRRYCYTGKLVKINGKVHVLCRPLKFQAEPFTVEQHRWRLRQEFAHGGWAWRHWDDSGGYRAMLRKMSKEKTNDQLCAVMLELADRKVPNTQAALGKLCEKDPLYLTRPWATKQQTTPRNKVSFTANANDLLAAALAKL